MTIEEAVKNRHTVRKYTDKKLSDEIKEKLNLRITDNNKKYNLNMQLMTDNKEAFSTLIKLFLAKNVQNYIILAGKDENDTDEKLGYCGCDVMLYAQTLGLNSWWVGETFSKKTILKILSLPADEKITGIIALGYGANNGTQHKSKNAEEISYYEGNKPEWFKKGTEAVLLAPTALNKQAFTIKGIDNKVSIICNNGNFSKTDLGIGKYHFEIGAGKDNFEWK